MYDLRQFKPSLYVVVMLGLTGFSLAVESPGLWGFCVLVVGVSAWLVGSGRYVPMPRWMASVVTLIALGYVFAQMWALRRPPLLCVGQFLAYLQLIKLLEQRANRDYAQLLVLSLLLMVAAAINTASLLFGILMLVYLVASLYCCLIFHLKIEADQAKAAFAVSAEKMSEATLQQDRRYFARSMRRLTALVWLVATAMAVGVFLFFPRGAGLGVLGQLQFKANAAMTGFSDRIAFDQINSIKQNDDIVAYVAVFKDEKRVPGTEKLFLRGLTLDAYGPDPIRTQRHQWTRARQGRDEEISSGGDLQTYVASSGPIWRQQIRLEPSEARYLFALPGVLRLQTERQVNLRYLSSDESLQTMETINSALKYEVTSTNEPTRPELTDRIARQLLLAGAESDPAILDRIRSYAMRPEVTDGLAEKRSRLYAVQESNEEIARKIEHHLRSEFSYTLELGEHRRELKDGDPVYNFLTKVKRGHCEYFASAMVLMCQSIGIPARVVIGFRCDGDSYNIYSSCYVVRQSNAHAWVEVLTPRGWVGFDPTSGREDLGRRDASLWQTLKQFLDFLEYKWGEHVVAYDSKDRERMLESLDTAMTKTAIGVAGEALNWREWIAQKWEDLEFASALYRTFFNVLSLLIAIMAAAMFAAIVWYLVSRWRLSRRAHRIGFDTLPRRQQFHLARQLAFYDMLTRALHRHRIMRRPHMTAKEFADTLVYLPADSYETIRRLTRLFYRVRFGGTDLSSPRQRRLEEVVRRLAERLEGLLPRRRSWRGPTE